MLEELVQWFGPVCSAGTQIAVTPPDTPNLASFGTPVVNGLLAEGGNVTFSGVTRNSGAIAVATPFSSNFTYRWGSAGGWTMIGGHLSQSVPFEVGKMQGDTSASFTLTNTGTLQVQHCVDSQGQVSELNEGDNCQVASFTVGGAPGLPECSDGVDNGDPEDSIADYPADPGCSDANDDDETDGGGPGPGGPDKPLFVTVVGFGTVTSNPAGISCSGTVSGNTCSAGYADSTNVSLNATASGGSTFAGWSDDCSGVGSCSVTMAGRRDVTATFTGGVDPGPGGPAETPTFKATNYLVKTGGQTGLFWDSKGGTDCKLTGIISGTYQTIDVVDVRAESSPLMVTVNARTQYRVQCTGGSASLWIDIDPTGYET
jgi:hypothetical protein